MPLFEYRCPECERDFELLVRGGEDPRCPECGLTQIEKLFSETATGPTGGRQSLPIAGTCPPGNMPCGPGCCRLP